MDQHPTSPSSASPLRLRLAPLLAVLALVVAACSSTGAGADGDGPRLRVTLKDYLGGNFFEIVSESYADRLEYLSQERAAASRKFLPDDALGAFLDYLEKEGLAEHGQTGRAPSTGGTVITRAFEVERDGEISCWPVGKGTANEEKSTFFVLMTEFVQLYTEIQAFQAIENPEGHDLFRDSGRQKTGR